MEDLFITIAGKYGKRFTRNQKNKFLEYLLQGFSTLGYTAQIKKMTQRVVNVYVGNLSTAKRLIMIPYDTPARLFVGSTRYYPFKPEKNLRIEFVNRLLPFLFFLIFVVMDFRLLANGLGSLNLSDWLKLIIVNIFLLCSVKAGNGFANRFNFVRNTAGIVIGCLSAGKYAKKNQQKDFALIFVDQASASYEGFKLLNKDEDIKNKRCIIFDCVGVDDSIIISHCDGVRQKEVNSLLKAGNEKGLHMSEHKLDTNNGIFQLFPEALYISGGKMEKDGVLISNTRSGRDRQVDFSVLQKIVEMM